MDSWHPLEVEMTGLKGRMLRLLTDEPTDDAGDSQDQLPSGITDVISVRDTVSPNLTVRVHPVGDPHTIAYIRVDQLALYDEQQP